MSFPDDASASPPVFSIIVPLEFHRGQWERCWKGWNDQTIARSMYETILVVPPGFQQQALLNEFSADRVEFSEHSHDIALCHAGAAKAQGKYLIFTGSALLAGTGCTREVSASHQRQSRLGGVFLSVHTHYP
jgi:hypothetical protein